MKNYESIPEAKESLYNLLPLIPKIMPKSVQPNTITISCHTKVQAEPGIRYIAAIKPDISTAIIPTQYPCLTRYGLFKSAFFFRKTTNQRETIQYARQQAKLAASTIQTSITLPKKGAIIDVKPNNNNAKIGVL